MTRTAIVLGAGMVGVSCALSLQKRGFDVTLIDRREPGRETSYGNAGVIGRSSLVPLNNPGLYAKLPADMDEGLALAALDVAGAPAQAAKLVKPGQSE